MIYNRQITLLFLFILFVRPIWSFSQEPATLTCLEVAVDGGTLISWEPPLNSIGFNHYEVYYSENGGIFTLIASIPDLVTNNYNHLASNANLASRYYYIRVVYDAGAADSDTLQTIFLQLDNNMPNYNQADLYWHAVSDPLPQGSSVWYKIYQEYPLGTWTLKDSVEGFFYSEPVIVCNDSISYKIVILNSLGCSSVSNVQGAPFYDVVYPIVPVFDSVSTNADGFSWLGWTTSISEDVVGYIIYKLQNTNWVEIDRIQGRDSTYYVDSLANACDEVMQYALAAIDSCGNKSPGTFLMPLQNMTIGEIIYDPCALSNTLSWTGYINAQPPLEGYKIFGSENGGPFIEIGETDVSTLEFTQTGLTAGLSYSYFIQAFYGDRTSSTCRRSMQTTPYHKPEYIYFTNADILPSGEAELMIEVDTNAVNCIWNIWRSGPNGGSPQLIQSFLQEETTEYPIRFTDETANGFEGYYQYSASVIDSCESEDLYSNELKTIFLTANIQNENINYLSWNAFEGWDSGVEKYYIFRMLNDDYPAVPLDSVNAGTLDYTDDITDLPGYDGRVTYWVQAVQAEGNIFSFREKSNSNQVLVATETEMYLPNAFMVGGTTSEFKPVFTYFGGTSYLFQIYSRWGSLIFESTNPDQGWDGKYKGSNVSLGVYSYKLAYNQLDGQTVVKMGTVTLIY